MAIIADAVGVNIVEVVAIFIDVVVARVVATEEVAIVVVEAKLFDPY